MDSNIVVPTLSLDGWVKSTAEKADYLMAHFFEAEYSQTQFYRNSVASFPWIIQNNQGDMPKTTRALQETLTLYFSRYFSQVVVQSSYKSITENSSQIQLNIYVSFVDHDNKEFSLARLVDVVDSKLSRVLTINNATGA